MSNTDEAATGRPTALDKHTLNRALKDLRRMLVSGRDDAPLLDYLTTIAEQGRVARATHGAFKRWSAHNISWLRAQAQELGEDHVGLYAGRRQWSEMGRLVREDAVPKVIWAYAGGRRTDDDDDDDDDEGGAAPTPRFVVVEVFDRQDTYPDPDADPDAVEPSWQRPLGGGDQATLARLEASAPVPVRFRHDLGGHPANGWLNADGITIDAGQPLGNQIKTLAHELAHHYAGHLGSSLPRHVREQEADLTAYIVAVHFGLDIDGALAANTADYLSSWVGEDGGEVAGHKRRMRMLNDRIERSLGLAEQILDAYDAADTPTRQEVAAPASA